MHIFTVSNSKPIILDNKNNKYSPNLTANKRSCYRPKNFQGKLIAKSSHVCERARAAIIESEVD